MRNLYEYDAAIDAAMAEAVDLETGEIVDEMILEQMEHLEMERDAKIENLALYIKDLHAEAEAIKAEKMALAKRQSQAEQKAEKVHEYLQKYLAGEKFKTARVAISYRKSESVDIDKDAFLPDEYLTYKAPEPNRVALKKALKEGTEIEGAHLISNINMTIK